MGINRAKRKGQRRSEHDSFKNPIFLTCPQTWQLAGTQMQSRFFMHSAQANMNRIPIQQILFTLFRILNVETIMWKQQGTGQILSKKIHSQT